ncbi:MAG: type II toxin-antitoxin system RelE/ParE family toxin [Candidatus Brocadiales bacterium]|nr:type II toxin-antitoxin system RelE/ParE family toxin [Candidatus Brocadiales bacterium]
MVVIETLAFTRRVTVLLSDDEYTAMQWFLRFKPDAGDIIQRTGGARKVRWRKKGQGKRGGLRIVYFHHAEKDTLWMLALYEKKAKEDLSESDKEVIKQLIQEITK